VTVSYGGDMPESYSLPAQLVVSLATAEARQLEHSRVGTEHLLLGLLAEDGSAASEALQSAGASLAAARHMVAELVAADAGSVAGGDLPLSARAQRALERAGRFSRRDRGTEVTAEHVLLGVLDVEGLGCQVLRGLAVDVVQLRNAIVTPAADAAPGPTDVPRSDEAVRPRCPQCRALLEDTLTELLVSARREAGSSSDVSIVYCAACGATVGVLRPDPSSDAR
jgi:ATP-dependent Clp protease ATP-binding subunit ClpA